MFVEGVVIKNQTSDCFLLTHSFILYIFVHVYPHSRERHDFFNGVLSTLCSSFLYVHKISSLEKKNYYRYLKIPRSVITSWSNEELQTDGGSEEQRTQDKTHARYTHWQERKNKKIRTKKLNKRELLSLMLRWWIFSYDPWGRRQGKKYNMLSWWNLQSISTKQKNSACFTF